MRVATVASAAAARMLGLAPPLTKYIDVRRGIGVRARDGAILRTDHYAPRLAGAPTVLVRTPYGRGGPNALAARVLAGSGFHVVVSSCRGTGGSSGQFAPMRHERDDGLDTVEWLRRQPWFTGRFGTFGPSYVGYTQWAIADVPELAAMATAITASQFRDPMYAGESFALYTTLAWASLMQAQQGPWVSTAVELLRGQPKLRQALAHLPLGEADRLAAGVEVEFFRQWVRLAGIGHQAADEYWAELNHAQLLPQVGAAVLMVGGWQDIFLPWQLRDYAELRAAGIRPRLIIGPWHHGSRGLFAATMRESITWLRQHLRDEPDNGSQAPVRVHVGGGGGWREYEDWPPATASTTTWFLRSGCRLVPHAHDPASHPESISDSFRYDPADPTPSVGGPLLLAHVAGPRDNRALEARDDVLIYTSEPLLAGIDVIGPVRATVYVSASGPHLDVFVRLCDVEPTRSGCPGRSVNICDALVRPASERMVAAAGAGVAVTVDLWPAAHRFRAGHRLRLQVSGGAYPRYARNLGTADAFATAVSLRPVDIEVFHDADRPSSIQLYVAPE